MAESHPQIWTVSLFYVSGHNLLKWAQPVECGSFFLISQEEPDQSIYFLEYTLDQQYPQDDEVFGLSFCGFWSF